MFEVTLGICYVCEITIVIILTIQFQKSAVKGEFNLDIMSQSGYWSYISVNNFHPLIVAFSTLVKKL